MGQVTEILRRARDLLAEPHAWGRGTFHRRHAINDQIVDTYCLVGAVQRAAVEVNPQQAADLSLQAERFIAHALQHNPRTNTTKAGLTGNIFGWNDHTSRRQEHVVDFLDWTVKKADEQDL